MPAGRRLVIEELSGTTTVEPGAFAFWILFAQAGDVAPEYDLPPDSRVRQSDGDDRLMFSEPVTIYADGGTDVCASLSGNSQRQLNSGLVVSGYTVAMP